jgi:hypothetical protein
LVSADNTRGVLPAPVADHAKSDARVLSSDSSMTRFGRASEDPNLSLAAHALAASIATQNSCIL